MNLVFIYGAPAVGKLTVAKELAKLTGYKLFHDHIVQDAVCQIFERESEVWESLRLDWYLSAVNKLMSEKTDVVTTFCYKYPDNESSIKEMISNVQNYRGNIYFTRLYCDSNINLQRTLGDSRKSTTKIQTPDELTNTLREENLISPIRLLDHLQINNTNLSPYDAAKAIQLHYQLPSKTQIIQQT